MQKIVINKGFKYTLSILPEYFIFGNNEKTIEQSFMFTDSCLYDDVNEQVNKIWGFSVGLFTNPRVESYRFGWNCHKKNGKIQIYEYVEKDYDFEDDYICDIEINKWYKYSITKSYRTVRMEIYDENDKKIICCTNDFFIEKYWKFCKTCRPYFGGELSAPHKIIIYKK